MGHRVRAIGSDIGVDGHIRAIARIEDQCEQLREDVEAGMAATVSLNVTAKGKRSDPKTGVPRHLATLSLEGPVYLCQLVAEIRRREEDPFRPLSKDAAADAVVAYLGGLLPDEVANLFSRWAETVPAEQLGLVHEVWARIATVALTAKETLPDLVGMTERVGRDLVGSDGIAECGVHSVEEAVLMQQRFAGLLMISSDAMKKAVREKDFSIVALLADQLENASMKLDEIARMTMDEVKEIDRLERN